MGERIVLDTRQTLETPCLTIKMYVLYPLLKSCARSRAQPSHQRLDNKRLENQTKTFPRFGMYPKPSVLLLLHHISTKHQQNINKVNNSTLHSLRSLIHSQAFLYMFFFQPQYQISTSKLLLLLLIQFLSL